MMECMKRRDFLRLSVLLLASCAVPGESLPSAAPTVRTATPASGTAACRPEPMVVPTRPAKIPTVYELDDVGLHVTAQPVDIDPATYHLQVSGLVDRPLLLSLDELRCLPQTTMKTTLTCPGYFSDRSTWGGTPLKPILDSAGVQPAAEKL